MLICYFLCWSLFDSSFWSDFHPIPELYANMPAFPPKIFPLSMAVGCHTHGVQMRGVGGRTGTHGWQVIIHGCVCKNILARGLMCQSEAQFQVPVRISVPQGTGESSSADHAWVRPRERNFNLTVNPYLYVRNGFINFSFHVLTQIWEWEQGFPS